MITWTLWYVIILVTNGEFIPKCSFVFRGFMNSTNPFLTCADPNEPTPIKSKIINITCLEYWSEQDVVLTLQSSTGSTVLQNNTAHHEKTADYTTWCFNATLTDKNVTGPVTFTMTLNYKLVVDGAPCGIQQCSLADLRTGYCDVDIGSSGIGTGGCKCFNDDQLGHWGIGPTGSCSDCLGGQNQTVSYYGSTCQNSSLCNTTGGICAQGECWGRAGNGHCTNCTKEYKGSDCSEPVLCDPVGGVCSFGTCCGLNGTGMCDNCHKSSYGIYCNNTITCNTTNGGCEEGCHGLHGNGTCTSCPTLLFYGPNCNGTVLCDKSGGYCTPHKCAGLEGDGKCTSCVQYQMTEYCNVTTPCNTSNGVCSRGGSGVPGCWGTDVTDINTVTCTSCQSKYYGKWCDNLVRCKNSGRCLEGECHGINGTGNCSLCYPFYYGSDCGSAATCSTWYKPGKLPGGSCNQSVNGSAGCYGINGKGECTSCFKNYYGDNCIPVNCTNGICDLGCYGKNGTGLCTSCKELFFGPTCEYATCDLRRGICEQGTCYGRYAPGTCTRCSDPLCYGSNCERCKLPTPGWFIGVTSHIGIACVFFFIYLIIVFLSARHRRILDARSKQRKNASLIQPLGASSSIILHHKPNTSIYF